MKTLVQQLAQIKVIPVIKIDDPSKAVPLAQVLIENGLPCAEITFRTTEAATAINHIRRTFPKMLIGAGTILTIDQVNVAIDAGADFIVSPGFNPNVVKYCQQRNITIIPGVNNPSLVEQAMSLGIDVLKFFPAEASGGLAMLNALSAVYPVQFMPTGGINPNNVNHYLSLPSVFACGGTWMVPESLIKAQKWDELAELVRSVCALTAPAK